ncbi:AAA family ATPase [Streptosporangium saharense]|uniref:AAA family ATPase n=1 Tax=Streptosporangium saharense TaxID=1706840 RepID=UPI00332D70C9
MRIDRLDLIAFGPFTGTSLDLSGPGVHLVTGPNEAGKSTALHALDQFLYGIDVRSPYDFVHRRSDLRLGALVRGTDGRALEIVRTRSRGAPLLGPDGRPLEQRTLDTVLGGIDRTTFTSVFALSSEELRRGGGMLARGDGDFGQALTASRSGLRLSEMLRDIDERTQSLFKRQGKNPRINARMEELKQARRRQRDASLPPQEYAQRERDVDEATETLARLEEELKRARGEQSRLERLDQALPALRQRQRLLSEIDEVLREGAPASEEAAERLPPLLEELRTAEKGLTDARRRLDGMTRELDGLAVDDDLLAVGDAVESLSQERRAVLAASRRLAKSAGVAAGLREEAQTFLRQVHPDAVLGETHRYRVPKAVRTRAQDLHERHRVLESELERSRRTLTRRQRLLRDAAGRLGELPTAENTGPLRAVLAAVPADLLNRLVAADKDERRTRGAVEGTLRALKVRTIAVDEADAVTVPTRAEVEAHADGLDELRQERRDLAKRRKELVRLQTEQRLALKVLLNDGPPPTEKDLAAARAARDALWREIRAGRTTGAEDFEAALSRTDRLADQMRRDAGRVAERDRLELQIGEGERGLTALDEEQVLLDRTAGKLDDAWVRLWEEFTGPRPTPKGAPATLEDVARLREQVRDLSEARARLTSSREQAAQHVARLREILCLPGDVTSPDAPDLLANLPELRERAEARLATVEEAAREREMREERVVAAGSEVDDAEADVADRTRDLADWKDDWAKLLVQAGLPAGHDTVEAITDLDRLELVATKATDAARSERETGQDMVTVTRFATALENIVAVRGLRLPDDETERYRLVDNLHEEAKKSRLNAERRAFLRTGGDELTVSVNELQETVGRLKTELTALVEKAGVNDVEKLREAVRRRTRLTDLTATLSTVTATLPAVGDRLDALMRDAESVDPDQLQTDLEGLTNRVGDLENQWSGQSRLSGEKENELARLDGSSAAAQAAAEAETAAAALVEESEEYLRLRVARSVLVACAEEYRQSQQNPVLARASRLFGKLTLNGFNGLELDEEVEPPIVLAQRGNDLLGVNQLSEGTRDQLYLALRLASLERYAQEGHTLPFVVDDIFMTFDDERTRATLGVLNEMANRFQMIVFTHHDHLVDLALAELPEERVHVHRLPRFVPVCG